MNSLMKPSQTAPINMMMTVIGFLTVNTFLTSGLKFLPFMSFKKAYVFYFLWNVVIIWTVGNNTSLENSVIPSQDSSEMTVSWKIFAVCLSYDSSDAFNSPVAHKPDGSPSITGKIPLTCLYTRDKETVSPYEDIQHASILFTSASCWNFGEMLCVTLPASPTHFMTCLSGGVLSNVFFIKFREQETVQHLQTSRHTVWRLEKECTETGKQTKK